MNEEYIDIQVYDGDDETRYIKYEDMINLIEKIKIKQDERDKEIERLNNIINELETYIKDELILDFYNDDMPCELIVNKMENMIKKLKGSDNSE